jgi:hypothetical protein
MVVPDVEDWPPGFVIVTVLVMSQVNPAVAVNPAASVVVTLTGKEPAIVGVPEIVPDAVSIDRPGGRPVAE